MKINWTYATKFFVSLAGVSYEYFLQYPHISWQQLAAGLVTSALVWLVPNTPALNSPVNPPATSVTIQANARDELNALRAERDSNVS